MLIPVRCFTCGKIIGHMWNDYIELVENKKESNNKNSDKTAEG